MGNLIIGNIIALIGSLIMVYSGIIKNKKKIIYAQTIQIMLFSVSNFILGGITGALVNLVCCIRNILCYKNKLGNKEKMILLLAVAVLSIYFNTQGIIGYIPLISTIVYTLFMNTKDVLKFKYLVIFSMFTWFIYDIFIKSYTSAVFDFLSVISNVIAIYEIKVKKEVKAND